MKNVTLSRAEVASILEGIRKVNICLIGDVCLDLYWHADMRKSRLSRETPHHPLPVVQETCSAGGGGNVACNISALGAGKLTAVSAIADDWRGFMLKNCLREHGIDTSCVLYRESGLTPCYCKPLRHGISDVVYEDPRLDFENLEDLTARDEEKLLALLDSAAAEADVVAVSDQYLHGVITKKIRRRLSETAKRIPVVVDSRERVNEYSGVIIKPNETEAATAAGRAISEKMSIEEYAEIGTELQRKNEGPVIITLGGTGSLWCDGEVAFAPTAAAKPPIDTVGAGDTFLSAFCCALGAIGDGAKAVAFANLASGVTVKKIGTTGTATPNEIMKEWEDKYN